MTKWSEIYLYIYMKKNFGKKNWITKGHKNRMNITQFLNTRNRGSRANSLHLYIDCNDDDGSSGGGGGTDIDDMSPECLSVCEHIVII